MVSHDDELANIGHYSLGPPVTSGVRCKLTHIPRRIAIIGKLETNQSNIGNLEPMLDIFKERTISRKL